MPQIVKFTQSAPYTLGVEIELQLLNPQTLDLTPQAFKLMRAWDNRNSNLKPELFQSMIEINTGICKNAHEAERDLNRTIRDLRDICDSENILIATTGTHPFAKVKERKIFPATRYRELSNRNQFIARRLLIFGLHVHIGTKSGRHCIELHNKLMRYLPHLLALSASSPFFEGEDTGLASSRITFFEALPTGGHPCAIRNWNEYEKLVGVLLKSGAIRDLKDIWWDMRPSPGYGTLEVRICDGMATISETMAIVAYLHCLSMFLEKKKLIVEPEWMVRENKWRASRHGLEAEIVTDERGHTADIQDDILEMCERLKPLIQKFQYESYFEVLKKMMKKPGYRRQRRIFMKSGDLKQVVRQNIREFREDSF